jgi:hypothetical protein
MKHFWIALNIFDNTKTTYAAEYSRLLLLTYVRRGKRMQAADTAEEEQAETLAAANPNPSDG